MDVPAWLHGRFADVARACKPHARALLRGEALAPSLVSTGDRAGLLVLAGPSPLLGGDEHFHLFALVRTLAKLHGPIDANLALRVVTTLAQWPWGFLAMMGADSYGLLRHQVCHPILFAAARRCWDEVAAEGARYTSGGQQPTLPWPHCRTLMVALAEAGVPREHLGDPRSVPALLEGR